MEEKSSFRARLIFFGSLAAIYIVIFFALWNTPFFDVTGAHNDRLFSADDVYYSTHFFSSVMDSSPRIIKHPLLIVLGCIFTRVEDLIFGGLYIKSHYALIVLMQMCMSVLSSIYLERILRCQYGLSERRSLLLCGIYALAFSTLFYTFVAENYIVSSLLLIMSYYYARRGSAPVTAVLGVLTAGVTITNAIIWAIIVWLSFAGSKKRRLVVLAISGAAFCLVTAISPVGRIFFSQIISGGLNSAESYSDHFGFFEVLRRVFFIFFGSTVFYIRTVSQSPFGDFPGDALSFLPSAPALIVILALLWLALILWSAVYHRKNRLLWAPLGVLGFNLLLHGVIQYGLKEGFLYSLHHLSAQILIAALSLGAEAKKLESRVSEIFLWCFALGELTLSIPGYIELARFITR